MEGGLLTAGSIFIMLVLDAAGLGGLLIAGFSSVVGIAFTMLLFHIAVCLIMIRSLAVLFPIRDGEFPLKSKECDKWQAQAVLGLFSYLYFDQFVPVVFKAQWYRLFGARLGRGVFISGRLVDCSIVAMDENSALGVDGLILGHTQAHGRVRIGHVMIGAGAIVGARAVVLPGATMGQDATLAASALLPSGKVVPPGETWAGIPAQPLGKPQTQMNLHETQ